jgi:hypothetical protein
MTSRDFAFWLQGVFEVGDVSTLSAKQVTIIKNHLNLVFKHEIDPAMGDESHQMELNKIHSGDSTEIINIWGPQPTPNHILGLHGWYDPSEGVLRC